jgi:Holliday junction DNA helicase RuvA
VLHELLGELQPRQLVRAILQADLRLLARAPGVGKRTAERLAVELRSRLQQRFAELAGPDLDLAAAADGADAESAPGLDPSARDEVQLTLSALGYELLEIQRALRAVAAQGGAETPSQDPEAWIAACLRWLSRSAA